MHYIKRKECIAFGEGQRSSGVIRGQNMKTLLAQYLQRESMETHHTWFVDAFYEENPIDLVGSQSSW